MKDKSNIGTPYDDAFQTMVNYVPELLIPLVNEIFHEHFHRGDRVRLTGNDVWILDDSYPEKRRHTDSNFEIDGSVRKRYHIECQSDPDGIILIRMAEYDISTALKEGVHTGNVFRLTIPNSAILFLRHTDNTPDEMMIQIATPGGEVEYPVRVMKTQTYPLDEIFDKSLYFLLPFYIFVYEHELPEIENNAVKLQELHAIYSRILSRLDAACTDGKINRLTVRQLHIMINHVLQGIARKYERVKGIGDNMFGKVIESDIFKTFEEASRKGIEQGIEQGLEQGEYNLDRALNAAADYLEQNGRASEIPKLIREKTFRQKVLQEAGITLAD